MGDGRWNEGGPVVDVLGHPRGPSVAALDLGA